MTIAIVMQIVLSMMFLCYVCITIALIHLCYENIIKNKQAEMFCNMLFIIIVQLISFMALEPIKFLMKEILTDK